jgi:hypothetical protein
LSAARREIARYTKRGFHVGDEWRLGAASKCNYNLYVVRRSLGIILLNLQPNNGTSNRREHEPMAKQAKNFMH